MSLDELLRLLVEELERIGQVHEELCDTEVRERIGAAVMDGFVRHIHGFKTPFDLGMFSNEANAAVRTAIDAYIVEANKEADSRGLMRFHDRLAAFQNGQIRTVRLRGDYEEFFGHTPPEFYDKNGIVQRTQ